MLSSKLIALKLRAVTSLIHSGDWIIEILLCFFSVFFVLFDAQYCNNFYGDSPVNKPGCLSVETV